MNPRLLPILASILSGAVFAADGAAFRDAAKHHRAGDTAAAIAIWQPLAQKGDANAASISAPSISMEMAWRRTRRRH
jgi:hypothetical protein